jgi:hypothetical protein
VVGSGDSFVNCYLPYFRQRLILHLLSVGYGELPLLPPLVEGLASRLLLQTLFTESSHAEQLLAFPASLVERLTSHLLLQALFTENSHRELPASPFSSGEAYQPATLAGSFY